MPTKILPKTDAISPPRAAPRRASSSVRVSVRARVPGPSKLCAPRCAAAETEVTVGHCQERLGEEPLRMRSWWQFDRPAVWKKTRFGRQHVVTIVMDYGMYRFTLRCMDVVLFIPLYILSRKIPTLCLCFHLLDVTLR